jgi:Tol biopolymer transport system component
MGSEGASQPCWRPDGRQIIFSSFNQGTSHAPALWVVDFNGENLGLLHKVSPDDAWPPPLGGYDPSWNPDGSIVAFHIYADFGMRQRVCTFNTISQVLTYLTDSIGHDYRPRWDPIGNRVMYSSTRDTLNPGDIDVFLFDLDTNRETQLTYNGSVGFPTWMPDARSILYRSQGDLYTLDLPSLASDQVVFSLDPRLRFAPLCVAPEGDAVLLQTYSIVGSRDSESLQVLLLAESSVVHVHSVAAHNLNSPFMGADWVIRDKGS